MISKAQFATLINVIDRLNHYQLLKVGITATTRDIQDAFHREALSFHPDRYQGIGDPETLEYSKTVYARVVEAYQILSNKNMRQDYDLKLKGPNTKVSPESEDEITSVRFKKSTPSPVGQKFFKLAQTALQTGNLSAAKINIQLALNTDPDNRDFRQLLNRIESGLKKPK